MAKVVVSCNNCNLPFLCERGAFNRAKSKNGNLFCGRKCAGLHRRKHKTESQKKAEKAAYDREYRRKNQTKLKAQRAEYFRRTYDPEEARIKRKERSSAHAEYCRRPEYRAKKHRYDRERYARKKYGGLWEVHVLSMDIREHVRAEYDLHQMRYNKGRTNLCQRRKREHGKTHS